MLFKKINLRSGFSHIEVLVSISVIAAISALLYFSYSASTKNLGNARVSFDTELKYLKADNDLRKVIERVRLPYWEKDIRFTIQNNRIYITRVDGNKEPYELNLPEYVKINNLKKIKNSDKVIGLELTYYIKNKECKTSVLFSSIYSGESLF